MAQSLSQLFFEATGKKAGEQVALTASGSNRRYYRIVSEDGEDSLIGVQGTSRDENHAFLYMAEQFLAKGLNVPKVLAVSDDEMNYVQQDLGNTLLFDYIAEGRKTGVFSAAEKEMLRKTMRGLAKLQVMAAEKFDFNQCYPQPEFNLRSILWDLNYFKYCFLKATGLEFQEDKLENEFERLAYILLQSKMSAFMYRDFQSRNVMVVEKEAKGEEAKGEKEMVPYFIDFQGGRKGPVYYDVASFLWQAKANFHPDLREELVEEYIDELQHYMPVDREEFYENLKHFVLFRTMQVLGAYGFRGYFEKKPYFIQSVPFALENLRDLLETPFTEFPYLNSMLTQLINLKQFTSELQKQALTVKVMSFSYKKGIPNDASGNGGGFVFDCRAINNPGKYDRYKPFTGLDECVIKYLEDDGGILEFLDHAYALVDSSVQRYIERGFTNLMVCFGCTGGRHRSVYSAQHMAEHIHKKWNVRVELVHREQNIEEHLRPKRN